MGETVRNYVPICDNFCGVFQAILCMLQSHANFYGRDFEISLSFTAVIATNIY